MNARTIVMRALLVLCVGGCQTNFIGDAKFPGGPTGCSEHCHYQGLKMSAFVYAGEYSTACVCEPIEKPAAGDKPTIGAVGPAAVGVVMQARAAQQAHQPRR